MSSEKSVPGEEAREAELQVEMKKMQVRQIPHFPQDTREVPSSERELDATPIIPNPQDQDSPEGPADTSPVTSTAPGSNIPEIAEGTAPAPCTAQDHNTPEIAEGTAPATTAQDDNTHEITGDTAPVMGSSHTTPVISTPPDSTVPEDPANSPSTTPVSVSPPGEIKIDSVEIDSVSLSWGSPAGMDVIPPSLKITYSHSVEDNTLSITAPSNSTFIPKLRPGREYSFTITTMVENGTESTAVSAALSTKPSPPGEINIDSVEIESVSLSWGSPDNMDGIPHSFKITYSSSVKDNPLSIIAPSNSTLISELRPGREYSFTVTTVLENGTQSTPVSTSVCTKWHFVNEHRFALIQRVVSVETVADALLEKRILQEAQYDEILAEKVSSAQMRLLYKFTRAWGNSEKDVFLEILKKQQPHLIKDLQGDKNPFSIFHGNRAGSQWQGRDLNLLVASTVFIGNL